MMSNPAAPPKNLGLMAIFNPISGPGPNARWVTGLSAFTRGSEEWTSFALASAFEGSECPLTNPGSVQIKIPVMAAMRLVYACRITGMVLDLRPENLRIIEQAYARSEGVFSQAKSGILDVGGSSLGHGYDGQPGYH